MKKLPIDPFLAAMIIAVVIASLAPGIGASGSFLHLEIVTQIGVALVFFFAGAGLSLANLAAGAANWRLHLLVQCSTFLLFPAIGVAFVVAGASLFPKDLLAGFFYLCALPSTISTSIAMTQMARGNVAGAIFNATLSSLLGMVVTPLLVNLYLHTGGHGGSMSEQFIKIAESLFLPLVLGQIARRWIGAWVARNKRWVTMSDRSVIMLIVFNAFSDSTRAGLWSQYGWVTLVQTGVLAALLLGIALSLTTLAARRLNFNTEDEIAGVFCGSKKSIAVGIPMAKLLMGNTPLGMIVLPVMFYHQLQLFVCTVLAQRYAARPAVPVSAAVSA